MILCGFCSARIAGWNAAPERCTRVATRCEWQGSTRTRSLEKASVRITCNNATHRVATNREAAPHKQRGCISSSVLAVTTRLKQLTHARIPLHTFCPAGCRPGCAGAWPRRPGGWSWRGVWAAAAAAGRPAAAGRTALRRRRGALLRRVWWRPRRPRARRPRWQGGSRPRSEVSILIAWAAHRLLAAQINTCALWTWGLLNKACTTLLHPTQCCILALASAHCSPAACRASVRIFLAQVVPIHTPKTLSISSNCRGRGGRGDSQGPLDRPPSGGPPGSQQQQRALQQQGQNPRQPGQGQGQQQQAAPGRTLPLPPPGQRGEPGATQQVRRLAAVSVLSAQQCSRCIKAVHMDPGIWVCTLAYGSSLVAAATL